jgi:ankyrin repeat protein
MANIICPKCYYLNRDETNTCPRCKYTFEAERMEMGNLFEASKIGNVQRVQSLLVSGASPNDIASSGPTIDKNYEGSYPLHIAVRMGHVEVVKILLEHGADPTVRDKFGKCPIDYSEKREIAIALRNNPKQMQLLSMRNELANAADKGDLDTLNKILDQGVVYPNDHATGDDRLDHPSALHLAASQGFGDIVLELIRRGADVNVQDISEVTPLHYAARKNKIETAKILLDAGANVNAKNIFGNPLIDAAMNGHLEMVKLLLSHGADLKCKGQGSWWTALDYACFKGNLSIVRVLLEHGAEINTYDSTKSTPLHHAASGGHLEVVRLLINKGALSLSNRDGEYPVDSARERKLPNWKELENLLGTIKNQF